MLNFKNYIAFAAIVLLVLVAGCGKKQPQEPVVDYKSEAKALCEVFNPEKWKDMPADLQPAEIQQMLADKIAAAVNSEKMIEVINTIPNIPADLRYKYVVESISELTGETFTCPGMEDYFSP